MAAPKSSSTGPRCMSEFIHAHIPSSSTAQGMARVRSGQAPAWPLASDRRGAEAPTLKEWVPKMLSAKRF